MDGTGSPIDGVQDGTPSQGSRKRTAPSSRSRGVASLTPDQLAKKRANDREAQRAIRERTKQTIDTLEAKIKDLTAQQPYQELQAVLRQKDAIQTENEEMRRRMASIMGLIQPIIGAQGLTGTYSMTDVAYATEVGGRIGLVHNINLVVSQANLRQRGRRYLRRGRAFVQTALVQLDPWYGRGSQRVCGGKSEDAIRRLACANVLAAAS